MFSDFTIPYLVKPLFAIIVYVTATATSALSHGDISATHEEHPYIRLELRYPGMYNITGEEMANAGVDLTSINPRNLALYNAGKPKMLRVIGIEDGKFDLQDQIHFIGNSPRGEFTWLLPENKRNVYFLTWTADASTSPARTISAETKKSTKRRNSNFWQWKHIEKDYLFWYSTLPPNRSDNFFWYAYRAGTPSNRNFRAWLDFPGFNKSLKLPVDLNIQVYGVTNASGLKPTHQFEFLYNSEKVGSFSFDGIDLHQFRATIPAEVVSETPQRFAFRTPPGRMDVVDSINLDWIEARYPSRFDGSNVEFYTFNNDFIDKNNRPNEITVESLVAGSSVFDEQTNTVWQLAKDQTSAIIPTDDRLTTYYAVAPYRAMQVDQLDLVTSRSGALPDIPSELQTLVIYHPNLKKTAEMYVQYRRERGWSVIAASTHAIFDTYNNGFISDLALKEYIQWVRSEATNLSHIVLIGDAFYDYREARSFDDEKQYEVLVPIHWVHRPGVTYAGGYQDDNWYGSFQNEFRPDVAVGRIAVNSDHEGIEYLRKVIEYEVLRNSKLDKGLLISSVEKSFQQYVTEIGTKYQDKLSSVSYLFPEAEKATQEVTNLLNEINRGAQIIYYVGHGGSMVWRVGPVDFARQKDLFTPDEVSKLKNHGHYPVVVCASCYTTSFDQPKSIGEALVNEPNGGAIAVIGAPWKATVQESHDFNRHLFKYYFDPDVKTIGEASLLAHRDHISADQSHALFNSFTMLGDPCLEIIR